MRKRRLLVGIIPSGLALCTALADHALAQSGASTSTVPQSGLYIGLGGSYNFSDFGNQDVFAIGTSKTFLDGALVRTGLAAGPTTVRVGSKSAFAPTAQLGYFQRFAGSDWLWGVDLTYQYLNASATVHDVLLPQFGAFTSVATGNSIPFIGSAVVRSFQVAVTHQLALFPLVGHAFERSFIYAGAGPTLSRLQTKPNGVTGFADINGRITEVSGAPVDFSSSSWMFGGAVIAGVTFYFDPSWFLDLRYMYAATANQTSNYLSPFVNPNGSGGSVVSGNLIGSSSGRVTTQGVTLTINKAF